MTIYSKNSGFTLIEVLVSVSIFSMVMLVATGAVFSVVQANKKAHSLKSVMTNLNFALESMARDIRVGSQYSCEGAGDCASSPGDEFSYKANRDLDGNTQADDFVRYRLVVTDGNGGIEKRIYGGSTENTSVITADEIDIDSLNFYVIGTAPGPGDTRQPKVVITIEGSAGGGGTVSTFNIQTTLSQRAIDS